MINVTCAVDWILFCGLVLRTCIFICGLCDQRPNCWVSKWSVIWSWYEAVSWKLTEKQKFMAPINAIIFCARAKNGNAKLFYQSHFLKTTTNCVVEIVIKQCMFWLSFVWTEGKLDMTVWNRQEQIFQLLHVTCWSQLKLYCVGRLIL